MPDRGERLVGVALSVGVDHEFTYRVPHALPMPVPGTRVLVPFGRRRLTGIVLGATDPADVEVSLESVRDVERVLDDAPALPASLLELARFVADYYACPIGEALRAVQAGAPATEGTILARLTQAGRLALGGAVRGERQRELLAALESRDETLSKLARRLGEGTGARLRELERRGWVELLDRTTPPGGDAVVQTWTLAPDAPLSGAVARRGSVGEALRVLLAEHHGGLSAAEAARLAGRSEDSVRQAFAGLVRRGVAVRGDRVVRRVPALPAANPASRDAIARRTPSEAQAAAIAAATRAIDAADFSVLLVEGVTGSGKTEVYLSAFEHARAAGRTGICLVPEISLTPLLMRTVKERFGERTAILHSGLSAGERHDERSRILAGEVDVVLGARSAIFAPLPRLGLVVVDEEHDPSYKQDSQPRYNGRDVAIVRARIEGASVILGSATPSLESYQNARSGRYALARMPDRVGGATPATVELVDMREEWRVERGPAPLSRRLRQALGATLASGRQAMILLNRRGWADFLLCRECGEPERCDRCAVTLTVHLRQRTLLCHYCGLAREIPAACRNCGGTFLQNVGQGTEQLEASLAKLLPGVAIGRLDADVARRKGAAAHVLAEFEAGNLRVLLGTQMIAKGHDFPNVTLVGVLQADRSLWLPDFRAAERTFQLLVQVAGRSGRGRDPGLVVVQTYSPDHPAILFAQSQDYQKFFEAEASHREALGYPPFRRLVALLVSGEDASAARAVAEQLGEALRREAQDVGVVLGPAPAPIARIKDRWRFQLLVKGPARKALNRSVRRAVASVATPGDVRVDVDVDPQSLL